MNPYISNSPTEILLVNGWHKTKKDIWTKDGHLLSLKILVNINNPRHIKIADWLQKKLTAFGVEIHIIKEPANIFVNYSVKKAKFDSIALLSSKANKRILWDFHTQNIMKESGQQGIVNFLA